MQQKQKRLGFAPRLLSILLGAAMLCGLAGCGTAPATPAGSTPGLPVQSVGQPAASSQPSSPEVLQNTYSALPLPQEMRAMWVSFLEWNSADIATEAGMRNMAAAMLDNCKDMGLNTVIVAVRSFSDALYQSSIYPWSHLITGTQGQAPGYDPLAVLTEEAHARGLRLEAMVNPYRAQHSMFKEVPLAESNPASQHPDWVREVAKTLWFNPGQPEVNQMVVNGVAEIVAHYDVDGIQFDDYFYPSGIDESFDKAEFTAHGGGKTLADWRMENISGMVRQAYAAVKAANPTVSFGISPAGNNENNREQSYADVNLWMQTPGYVDYVMPQLYWGFNYQSKTGSTAAAFANKCAEWAAIPRSEGVRLFAGLAAYATQEGDGSAADQSEWQSGHILADMVTHLRQVPGFSGFALFRYSYLANNSETATKEVAALKAVLTEG